MNRLLAHLRNNAYGLLAVMIALGLLGSGRLRSVMVSLEIRVLLADADVTTIGAVADFDASATEVAVIVACGSARPVRLTTPARVAWPGSVRICSGPALITGVSCTVIVTSSLAERWPLSTVHCST